MRKPRHQVVTNRDKRQEAVDHAHSLPVCEATGKRIYKHQQDAAKAIGAAMKLTDYPVPRSCFRCEHCGRWHLTSLSQIEFEVIQLTREKWK